MVLRKTFTLGDKEIKLIFKTHKDSNYYKFVLVVGGITCIVYERYVHNFIVYDTRDGYNDGAYYICKTIYECKSKIMELLLYGNR